MTMAQGSYSRTNTSNMILECNDKNTIKLLDPDGDLDHNQNLTILSCVLVDISLEILSKYVYNFSSSFA